MGFFKSFSIYTISGFIGKGISFLMLPFFTHYLTTEDYGILTIFTNSIFFIAPLMNMGVGEILTVEYAGLGKKGINVFISTSLIFPFVIFIISELLLIGTSDYFNKITGLNNTLLYLIAVLSVFHFFSEYIMTILRNENKPVFFGLFGICKTALELVLAVYFIKFCREGFQGRVNSIVISSATSFLFIIVYFVKRGFISFNFSKKWFFTILKRGLPTIPFFFMIFTLSNIDKYMLNYFYGKDAAGIYGLAWQFAMIINLLIGSFIVPFNPYMYAQLRENKHSGILKIAGLFVIFLIISILLLYGCCYFLFEYFISSKFIGSVKYILPLCFGQFFWALFVLILAYLYYKKENNKLYWISSIVIIVTIIINYLVIKNGGQQFTAYASMLSYFVGFITISIFYMKPIIRNFKKIKILLLKKKLHKPLGM